MMIPAVSGCGTYIASVANAEIQVHKLLPSSLYRRYDLNRFVSLHCLSCNYPQPKARAQVHIVEWEIPAGGTCGKLAAYVSAGSLQLVLIFDFVEKLPAVIEVDRDGVAALQWIKGAAENGAYSNSTQIGIFMSLGTELRVYSLDCTLVQFTVPKPAFDSILARPGTSSIWTVVASPYHDKNSSLRSILVDSARTWPSILQFYSDGSTSKLLANLSLDFTPSTSSEFVWSPSGKWLLYFDDSESLSGYTLKIFNVFAIHSRNIDSPTNHLAQATLEYTGGSTEMVTNWLSTWGSINDTEFVVVVAEQATPFLELKAYAISDASSTEKIGLDITKGFNWIFTHESNGSGSYQEHTGNVRPVGKWKKFTTLGDKLLLATDNVVAVLLVKVALPLFFVAEYTVSSSLPLLDAYLLSDSEIALVFTDHVAVLSNVGFKVLATSRYRFKKVHFSTSNESTTITLVEESPSGPIWRQIIHNALSDTNEDSNLAIMKQFDYNEENSKVVKLMKDVQHTEWGQQGKRAKEDITDTFHLNSKRRRNTGILRSAERNRQS